MRWMIQSFCLRYDLYFITEVFFFVMNPDPMLRNLVEMRNTQSFWLVRVLETHGWCCYVFTPTVLNLFSTQVV